MDLDTKARHRHTIRQLAEENFAHHVLTDLGTAGGTRVFRCAKPGTSMYGFRVLLWPGSIVVAGDVGDTMFRHSDRDSIGWLRGAHRDYLLGKVCNPHKQWMPGDAQVFVEREIATNYGEFAPTARPAPPIPLPARSADDIPTWDEMREAEAELAADELAEWERAAAKHRERAAELLEACGDFDDPRSFYEACGEAGIDDPPDCMDYDADHLWAVECLIWFIAAYDKAAAAEPHYIQHTDAVGDLVLWWRPNRCGYTTNLDEAGRYSREDAEAQQRSRKTDRAWPCSVVDKLAGRVVEAETANVAGGTTAR